MGGVRSGKLTPYSPQETYAGMSIDFCVTHRYLSDVQVARPPACRLMDNVILY